MEESQTTEVATESPKPRKRPTATLASKSRPRKAHQPREGSKKFKLIAMLHNKAGARIDQITERFGWRAHTVRGFLSTLQKVGLVKLIRTKDRKGRSVYRAA